MDSLDGDDGCANVDDPVEQVTVMSGSYDYYGPDKVKYKVIWQPAKSYHHTNLNLPGGLVRG